MQMVDVGCGIGGSSRHIAKKFSCTAEGITLSPVQVLPVGTGVVHAANNMCRVASWLA